jgi:hypothetical protein
LGRLDETRHLRLDAHELRLRSERECAISSGHQLQLVGHRDDIQNIAASPPPAGSDLADHAANLHREKYDHFLPDQLLKAALAKERLDPNPFRTSRDEFSTPQTELMSDVVTTAKRMGFPRSDHANSATAPVSHQKRPHQNATNAIKRRRKHSKINEANRYSAAHNGLVLG